MNNNLKRLAEPGSRLYMIFLVAFAAATLFFKVYNLDMYTLAGGEIHVQPLLLGGHAEVQQRLGDPKIDGRAVGVEVRLYVKGVDRGVDIAELLRRILIDGVIAVDQQELPARRSSRSCRRSLRRDSRFPSSVHKNHRASSD